MFTQQHAQVLKSWCWVEKVRKQMRFISITNICTQNNGTHFASKKISTKYTRMVAFGEEGHGSVGWGLKENNEGKVRRREEERRERGREGRLCKSQY